MNKVDVRFGEWIQKGFELYKANLATLILATLIAILLSVLTVGILAGPMTAGLVIVTLALLDARQPKPEVGDVFKGFSFFLPAFLYMLILFVVILLGVLILGFIPCAGAILGNLFCLAVATFAMFGIFNIVDRRMEPIPAMQASIEVVKTNFWPFLGLYLVASIIGSVGGILCGIGAFLTMPIFFCIIAVAYRESTGPAGASTS